MTTQADPVSPKMGRRQFNWLALPIVPLTLFMISLLGTAAVCYFSNKEVESRVRDRFSFRVIQVTDAVRNRMNDYEQVLRGGVGLFAASPLVTRKQWHDYVTNAQISIHYPGIQNMAIDLPIPAAQKDKHIAAVRAEGFAQYSIRPEQPERPVYHSLVYVEPFNDRNLRAFGFDMYTNPVRRVAMDRAIDLGLPSISGMVKLAQETNQDVQHGFIFCLPAYWPGQPLADPDRRRQALRALVCGGFRVNDLMRGIFGTNASDLELEIFDDGAIQPDSRMYSSFGTTAAPRTQLVSVVPIEVGGRKWALRVSANQKFLESVASYQTLMLAVAGILLNLALFTVLRSLSGRERRARQLADEITRELLLTESRFSDIVASASDAIISKDLGGVITSWNPGAERMFGYSAEEVIGKTGLPAESVGRPLDTILIKHCIERGEHTGNVEATGISKDGSQIEVSLTISPMRNPDGRVYGISEVMTDITSRKRAEQLKDEFVSTVSHELRTPLTSIAGALGLLTGGALGELPPQMKSMIDIAFKNSQRLTLLINDLLDMEKIAAGKLHFDMQLLALMPLVEVALETNKAYGEQHRVRFELTHRADDVRVRVDAQRFQQVLANFLSNAAKFSPEGGTIEVDVRSRNGSIRVAVHDHGPGVPSKFRERIFEKFSQADSSDRRQKGGTGLGLAITKELMKHMGGTVGFESVEGEGATFWLELPVQSHNAQAFPSATISADDGATAGKESTP